MSEIDLKLIVKVLEGEVQDYPEYTIKCFCGQEVTAEGNLYDAYENIKEHIWRKHTSLLFNGKEFNKDFYQTDY